MKRDWHSEEFRKMAALCEALGWRAEIGWREIRAEGEGEGR